MAYNLFLSDCYFKRKKKQKVLPSQNYRRPLARKRQRQKWRFVNINEWHEHVINTSNDKNNKV